MSSTPTFRVARFVVAIGLMAAGCGDDDETAAATGISSLDEWCATVGEVDVKFSAADTEGDEFAARQVVYAEIVGLIGNLEDSLEYVDESSRGDVATSLAFGSSIAGAFVAATDEEDAARLLEPVYGTGDGIEPGAEWIQANCGIDIDG